MKSIMHHWLPYTVIVGKKLGNLGYEPVSEKQEKNSLSKTLLLLTGKHDIIESQII